MRSLGGQDENKSGIKDKEKLYKIETEHGTAGWH